ncbi:MAG: molybdenum cofactor guanylyltransferase [Candidatus Bipolaricaulota bacterium]
MSRADATLIILAGGASKRMGRPKHLLPVAGGTLIEAVYGSLCRGFRETVVVGGVGPLPGGARRVPDGRGPRSPLLGIYSGLVSCHTELAYVVACDMPLVRRELVERVLAAAGGVDVAVPMARGHHEPLCAAYRRTALPLMRRALSREELKITALYERLDIRRVPEPVVRAADPKLQSFVNLNTPQDIAQLCGAGGSCAGRGGSWGGSPWAR